MWNIMENKTLPYFILFHTAHFNHHKNFMFHFQLDSIKDAEFKISHWSFPPTRQTQRSAQQQ